MQWEIKMDHMQMIAFKRLLNEFEQCVLDVCAEEYNTGLDDQLDAEKNLRAARERVLDYAYD